MNSEIWELKEKPIFRKKQNYAILFHPKHYIEHVYFEKEEEVGRHARWIDEEFDALSFVIVDKLLNQYQYFYSDEFWMTHYKLGLIDQNHQAFKKIKIREIKE